MVSLAKLKKTADSAMGAYYRAKELADEKQNKKLVGKTFKYRNSGFDCDTSWWLYAKIMKAEGGNLRVFTFEILPNGNIAIDRNQYAMPHRFASNDGYSPISAEEFDKAWLGLMSTVASI